MTWKCTHRYDLFNVRLRRATFSTNGLQYTVADLDQGGASGASSSVYRGPSLRLLQPGGGAWPMLLVLHAPGILEVRCFLSEFLLACPSRK